MRQAEVLQPQPAMQAAEGHGFVQISAVVCQAAVVALHTTQGPREQQRNTAEPSGTAEESQGCVHLAVALGGIGLGGVVGG